MIIAIYQNTDSKHEGRPVRGADSMGKRNRHGRGRPGAARSTKVFLADTGSPMTSQFRLRILVNIAELGNVAANN